MAYLPLILSAAGAVAQASAAHNAQIFNASAEKQEANTSINQANAAEGLQRKLGRQALGREAAAFGGANVGYGGSSGASLDQTATNAEIDDLNTRYKGIITAYGYNTQAQLDQQNARADMTSGLLLAGAKAYQGITNFNPPPPSTQAAGYSSMSAF